MESLSLHSGEDTGKHTTKGHAQNIPNSALPKWHLAYTPNVEDQTTVATMGPKVALDMHTERPQFAEKGGTRTFIFAHLICS